MPQMIDFLFRGKFGKCNFSFQALGMRMGTLGSAGMRPESQSAQAEQGLGSGINHKLQWKRWVASTYIFSPNLCYFKKVKKVCLYQGQRELNTPYDPLIMYNNELHKLLWTECGRFLWSAFPMKDMWHKIHLADYNQNVSVPSICLHSCYHFHLYCFYSLKPLISTVYVFQPAKTRVNIRVNALWFFWLEEHRSEG